MTASHEELLGIEKQIPAKGIIRLGEMVRIVGMMKRNRIIKFSSYKRSPLYIKDEELLYIDELLKAIKYSEYSLYQE